MLHSLTMPRFDMRRLKSPVAAAEEEEARADAPPAPGQKLGANVMLAGKSGSHYHPWVRGSRQHDRQYLPIMAANWFEGHVD